jgi:hypothetical protein
MKGTHKVLISAQDLLYECLSKKILVLIFKIAGNTVTGLNEAYFRPSKSLFFNITVQKIN